MHRSTRILMVILGAAGALSLGPAAASPVLAGDPCYHGFAQPALTVAAASEVKAMPCAFAPTVTRIPVGGTVTFRNGPEVAHLVTGANQAWGERDVELARNATVSYTFEEPGVYPYACALHRGMLGAIVVGDGGQALAPAMTGSSSTTGAGPGDDSAEAETAATGARMDASPGDIGLAAGAIAALLLGLAAITGLRLGRTHGGWPRLRRSSPDADAS